MNAGKCGSSWAEGYKITTLDGHEILLEPRASCFGVVDFEEKDALRAILDHLGYELEFWK